MSAMLASDLNNPQFVGAVNPDTMLSVEFFMHAPEDVHKSEAAGKVIRLEPMPYVRIQNPGDHTSIMEAPVTERHKQRWPDKWLYFQIKEGLVEGAADIPGWKLEEWTHLNPEQVRELKFMRFTVVEQLANASDDQCQKLGMSGMGLREAARLALRARLGVEMKQEMDKKDAEIAEMKERMARLESLLTAPKEPAAPAPAQPAPVEAVEPSERDALVAQHVTKFGKPPHHKAGVKKIRAALG